MKRRYVASVRYAIDCEVEFDGPADPPPEPGTDAWELLADMAVDAFERMGLRLPEGVEPWVEVDDIEEEAQ